jgi:hypothetical protein
MHYIFEGEREFSIYKYECPHPDYLILKNWSNKVNGTHNNFLKDDYNHIKSYSHKNGITVKHILFHN